MLRDGDLLDFDDDLDIYQRDLKRLQGIVPELRAAGFRLAEVGRKSNFMCFIRKGEKVDVDVANPDCGTQCAKKDLAVDQLDNITVRGRDYQVVTETYFQLWYGPDWRTPKAKWHL